MKKTIVVMLAAFLMLASFKPAGGVKVGENWATVHYRSNFFIIAVVDQDNLYDNPVIVAKQ